MPETTSARFFDSVIGHEPQLEHLNRLLSKSTVPHALLFAGPEGVGKRTVAWAFALALLAQTLPETTESSEASVEETIRLVKKGIHPDLHFVEIEQGKKEITVEAVRELSAKLKLRPYYARCSVAIINDAHLLNTSACNSLLMTLEEPPGHSYLLLASDSPHRLLPTIISRCQPLFFGELSESNLGKILRQLLEQEQLEPEAERSLLALTQGSFQKLGLARFIHHKTLRPNDLSELKRHLQGVAENFKKLERQLEPFFKKGATREGLASYAASLAANIAAEKEQLPGAWQTIQARIRKALREEGQKELYANALLQAIEAEQLTIQRNLNPQLQLTSLLLNLAP